MLTIETLARFQFGMTTIFHFFFVPLSIGLTLMTFIMEALYVKTGDEKWKTRTKFFGAIMLLSFAVGVVTGIIQEFQFGMNWSDYSRFVGDIFGAPLAVEALLAFFMESTFLGVWMFGWDRIGKKLHLAALGFLHFGFWQRTALCKTQWAMKLLMVVPH
ncbi:truncated cytochrome D ubiquinol oxidase subunit I [Lactococcus garvieae Lg2]|uniref:Truncated cytochrome D ubiquinol oxidase subunit I n=1 Tax=Lactococcus garvieae (strain Lg2) TaxID=420890 RepID=F9VF30_LACGL|nr:truncated cytochrome D ubiquinol oxidase subunit I [Lactococcus garvieae Lg2]